MSGTATPLSPELMAFIEALARAQVARDLKREAAEARRRVAEERSPTPTVTASIPARSGATSFSERDLTRALKASLKAGITPHRVELLGDGRILLHFTEPPPVDDER